MVNYMPTANKCIDPKGGDWVILMNDKIVECDSDIGKILQKAKKYQIEKITVSKVPSADYCFY